MMCKEMTEDLKRIRSLKDGRKDVENSGYTAIGFFEAEDYVTRLVDEEV